MKKIGMILFFLSLSVSFSEAHTLMINNFDDVTSPQFSYKDDKGSTLKLEVQPTNSERNQVMAIHYHVVPGGWAGWGLVLKGMNAEGYSSISFLVKGDKGSEKFEIGLKDSSNKEKKINISEYVDLGTEWRKIKIPLREFKDIDLTSLDNLSLGFSSESGDGTIYLDDFQFEVPEVGESEREQTGKFANKVLIDSFERANPTDLYIALEGDDSTLKLNSSRIAEEGDYSMELEYTLSTTRPWGSWVAARWQSKETTLDWQGTQDVKIWVKGDDFGNIFKFSIVDTDGEKWSYEDPNVLKSTEWTLVDMPIAKFVLDEKSEEKNGRLDLDQVRAYEISIVGTSGSKNTAGVKTSVGKIQVDYLYLTGENISSVWAVPPTVAEKAKLAIYRFGNIDFNGQLFAEYLYAPEIRSTINHFGKLIVNGKIKNYSTKIELASQTQEFGAAEYYNVSQATATGTTLVTQSPLFQQVNIQFFANNVSPYLTQFTLGNVFIDYSPYTFSPVFGFKGLTLEGDVDTLNYHLFALKHAYDSFTLGSRFKYFWEGFRLTGIGVYYRETAKVYTAGLPTTGSLTIDNNLQLRDVQNDTVLTFSADRLFWGDRFGLNGTFGLNRYKQLAVANRSDPFNPVFGNDLQPPLDVTGLMARGKLSFNDLAIPGLQFFYEYRSVDTEFKPFYRQNPVNFDDLESDQRGHNLRLLERWRGFQASVEYDTLKRASNDSYYKNRVNWAIGYYGFHNMDLAFNQEIRRELYQFTSDRTGVFYNQNDKVIVSEIYLREQLSPRLVIFFKPRREDVEWPDSGTTYANESIYGKLEFYVTTNLKVLGEFRSTHFGLKGIEPYGYPYSEHFVRTNIEFNF